MPRDVLAFLQSDTPSLRRIAGEASVGIAVVTPPDWRFNYANAAYQRFSDTEVVGRTLADVFPAMAESGIDLLDAPLNTGLTFSRRAFPVRLRESDTETWWDFDHIPLPGASGKPVAVLIIAREVSDHVGALKEAERARAELHANEERLRLAMMAGRMFCWDFDVTTKQVAWSEGLATALGMPEGSFGGTLEAFRSLVHPDDLAGIDTDIGLALAGKKPYDIQFRMVRADGSVRWVASKANVLRDEQGRPVRMVGIDLDITKEKEAETALRDSEATLRSLVEAAPVGLGIVDRDMRLRYVNSRLSEINGLPADAHVGLGLRELLGGLADRLEPLHRHVLETGTALERIAISGELPTRPGEQRHWLASYLPVTDGTGTTIGVKKVIVDVTAEHVAANDAEAARQLVRSVIDSIPDSVTVRDRDGRYIFANAAALGRLGRTIDELIGRDGSEILPADIIEAAHDGVSAVLRSQQPVISDEVTDYQGQRRHFHTARTPWRGKDGAMLGVVTVARDVTDRRRAEEVMAAMNTELERKVADRTDALARTVKDLQQEMEQRNLAQAELIRAQKLEALGQLTSGVAHDFNNVLTAIAGSFEMLERRLLDERSAKLIENGKRAAQRATGIVSRLMDHVRKRPSEPSVLDVAAALEETQSLLVDTIGGTIRMEVEVAFDIWPVVADPSQLQSALINLAVNGRDAMADGGTLRIAARNIPRALSATVNGPGGVALAPGDYVGISVTDTGTGMDADLLGKVLEPFFTTKAAGQGTGLGLPMVHRFAQESRGLFRLSSEPGKGTNAEVILPRADMAAAAADGAEDATNLSLHGSASILVVEDDQLLRPVIVGLLREYGYDVTEAPSVETAYAMALSADRLDLVLCDVVMPDSHGTELARRLRASRPNLPFLFVTGYGGPTKLAYETVLPKPFSRRQLGEAVLRALRRLPARNDSGNDIVRRGQRISSNVLRAIYFAWHDLKARTGFPRLGDFKLSAFDVQERSFIAECTDETTLRYVRVGSLLSVRAKRAIEGDTVQSGDGPDTDESALGGIAAAYGRCRRTRLPNYEYARWDLGDGPPMVFERLLLPFSVTGAEVTHLIGVVLISDPLTREASSGKESPL